MKKYILAGLAVLAAGGAAIIGLSGGDKGTAKALAWGDYRIAIADRACPEEGQPGYAYLREHCIHWRTVRDNWCVCVTDEEGPLQGELAVADLPAAAVRRLAVCQTASGERRVVFARLSDTVPPGWSCVLIALRVVADVSMAGVRDDVVQALRAKCCSSCPDACPVTGASWGRCPYCLLDGNCAETVCVAGGGGT